MELSYPKVQDPRTSICNFDGKPANQDGCSPTLSRSYDTRSTKHCQWDMVAAACIPPSARIHNTMTSLLCGGSRES